MIRKLYIGLLIAFIGFANCFPNEEVNTATEANKLETDDESRIIGGRTASKNQFPYVVSIQKYIPPVGWYNGCGGSIISPRTILTAAHCVTPKPTAPMRVVAGSIYSLRMDPAGQIRLIAAYKPHPDYQPGGRVINDIALVILAMPLKFGPSVQPIALSTSPPMVGAKGYVSGWGDTIENDPEPAAPELQYAEAQIYPLSTCEQVLGKLSQASQLCVGKMPAAYRASVCYGDSGGPLAIGNKVEGIVSYSVDVCGTAEVVFTAVNYFTPWIKENME